MDINPTLRRLLGLLALATALAVGVASGFATSGAAKGALIGAGIAIAGARFRPPR